MHICEAVVSCGIGVFACAGKLLANGTTERACYFGRLCLRYPLVGFRVPFTDFIETVGYF